MNNEIIIQITSGRGPAECCWVVSQVVKTILEDATRNNLSAEIIQRTVASEPGTLISAVLKLKGAKAENFTVTWEGTILWVGQSPYRIYHQRKNWFIGVTRIQQDKTVSWNENDIRFQTLRASGPGGQHVNKTESAVRAIHLPTGIQVTASDTRSQFQNKKLAIERLRNKIEQGQLSDGLKNELAQWQQHNTLERGNPVKVFTGRTFQAVAKCLVCLFILIV